MRGVLVGQGLLWLAWPGLTQRYFSLVSLVWILSMSFFCWFSRFSRAWRSLMKVASPCLMFIWGHRKRGGGLSHQGHVGC